VPNVAIVTDSCASIPRDLLETLGIRWVAYYIHRGQEVLRDLVTIQLDELLQWLPTAKQLPTTASPGPGDYLSVYQDLAHNEGVREIVSIHMTSAGSGAYQAAKAACSMAQEQDPDLCIEVIDTRNVSMCHGWMVIEAARAALAGASLAQVVAGVKRLINIKPLIGMRDGVIVPLGQVRSRSKAYETMVDMVEAAVGRLGKIKIAYVHAGAREEMLRLKAMIEERLTVVESLIAELSPALAVHTGPGTGGLCYYPLER
jgi:fatty acid-binding protein DegV